MTRQLEALRLVLGLIMVVTSVQYFMPFLVPFVPAPTWDDPMAARLVAAFDRSGLLAVAQFIHLVAGALLLFNRAVPFALAALMPVNVCGAYIALLLEGDPLFALFGVLTVALNALLMLAYLPWYRGVLEGGQLADDEEPEDGRNYESLFADPFSKAPRADYFRAALVLAAALVFYWFVVPFSNGTTGLVTLAVPGLVLTVNTVRAVSRRAG